MQGSRMREGVWVGGEEEFKESGKGGGGGDETSIEE